MIIKDPIDGRKVWEYVQSLTEQRHIGKDMERLNRLATLSNSPYLKKKWRVLLRQKKRTEPDLSDMLKILADFFSPIWQSVCDDAVFFGDWMPDIRRFL